MKRLFIVLLLILSVTTAFTQIVNKAEYFFDTDPGPGNGTPITISNPGVSVVFPVSIPVNLSPGFHWLAIRVKDSDGRWSLFSKRSFFIAQPATDLPIITGAEYFYDNDPGVGNGNSLPIQTPGFSVTPTFTIPVPANMTAGTHYLAIRMKDQAGHWSLFQRDSIIVGGSLSTITCPGNVVVSAASGQCSSIVNNIDATVSPQATSYTYSLTGATTGNGTGTASGKVFNVGVTTVKYALTDAPSTSCSFTVTVNSGTTPSVSINTYTNSICAGQSVTFSTTPVNGGLAPSYQWKLNGNNIAGAIYSPYQSSSLANGDVVSVVMTSSMACASPSSAISNAITMTVHPIVTPSVSITGSATSICPGQSVTFTATPVNGGTQPLYQWVKNGVFVEMGNTYQTSALSNGDSVYVILYNTTDCIPNTDIISNVIHMSVGQNVTPSVSISTESTTICPGQSVTFTANPVNGGSAPSYQWQLNGNNIPGATNTSYQSSSLQNGDKIKVIMTPSSSPCVSSSPISSNEITISVGSGVTPSVSIYASQTSICTGWLVKFYANPVNGGTAPVYQWKLNGNNVGTNSGIFQSTTLNDNDVVSVVMTSSLTCASGQSVESNAITITVGAVVIPSVSIEADNTTICSGTQVTFKATPTNGGPTPLYLWRINGNDVGDISDTYQSSTLANGDSIQVIMTSSLNCAIVSTAISNTIKMTVTQAITYYADKDGDGYGDASDSVVACGLRAGFVTNKSDCDDNNASIYPGAAEICGNGIDDNCNGQTDENCTDGLPTLITRNYPAKEGDVGFTTVNIEVSLDKPAVSPVSIKYKTINEDAIAGTDYEFATGTLTIAAGKTTGSLQVKVISDVLRESNERFKINFSDPVNVLLPADPNSHVMIIDDDKGKPNSASPNKDAMTEVSPFKIPTVVKRGTVWMLPQISNYENEVMILNVQGQVVSRFINYKNQTAVGNVASGLYFYRIQIKETSSQFKFYTGRLLITE